MDKKKVLDAVNKDKVAVGICGSLSNKAGIPPMYLRGGLIAFSFLTNPLLGVGIYGAGAAYKHFKKQ